MAIIKNPLFSIDARGALDATLIYEKQHGTNYAKRYAKPSHRPSAKQLAHRAQFAALAATWMAASDADKKSWATPAHEKTITNYDAYTQFNWQCIRHGQPTTTVYPPTPPALPFYDFNGGSATWWLWAVQPADRVTLTGDDQHVYASPLQDLTEISITNDDLWLGTFDFRQAAALQRIEIHAAAFEHAPTLTGLANINYLNFMLCPLTDYASQDAMWIDLDNAAANNAGEVWLTYDPAYTPSEEAYAALLDLIDHGWQFFLT
jgi:hypothetical protein